MRRLAIGTVLGAAAVVSLLGSGATSAGTGPSDTTATGSAESVPTATEAAPEDAGGRVNVLQVSGLFDDIVVESIHDAIERADDDGAVALILQVNSRGSVVDDATVAELLAAVDESPVPVAVWVGPTGARLYGKPAQLLAVADVSAMADRSRVGFFGAPLEVGGAEIDLGAAGTALRNRSAGVGEVSELDVLNQRTENPTVETIRNMVDALNGYEHDGETLRTTTETVDENGAVNREHIVTVVMSKLSLTDQLFHTVASPAMAYLLLLIGMVLLIFEFYTAGVGIAGVVGAGSLILACTGLAALPTRPWAVAALVLAMLAFAVDVQVGIPRFWTGVGTVLLVIGSLFLFSSIPGNSLRISWITLIAGIAGTVIVFTAGMPSMVRTRFATPTIGREWMIGKLGVVTSDVAPDGIVEVDGAQWRARTNRATPVNTGDQVRVAAIDGVTLEVEPLEGAARDYRERRSEGDGDTLDNSAEADSNTT